MFFLFEKTIDFNKDKCYYEFTNKNIATLTMRGGKNSMKNIVEQRATDIYKPSRAIYIIMAAFECMVQIIVSGSFLSKPLSRQSNMCPANFALLSAIITPSRILLSPIKSATKVFLGSL